MNKLKEYDQAVAECLSLTNLLTEKEVRELCWSLGMAESLYVFLSNGVNDLEVIEECLNSSSDLAEYTGCTKKEAASAIATLINLSVNARFGPVQALTTLYNLALLTRRPIPYLTRLLVRESLLNG